MQILAAIYNNKKDNYMIVFIPTRTLVSWNSELAY